MRPRAVVAALAVGSAVAAIAACTAFSDLKSPSPALPADSGKDGASADAATAGMLSLADAAKVCSLIAQCYALGEAINGSLRLALAEPSYSLCLTELTTTLEPKRPGRQITARTLQDLAGAATCGAAAKLLSLEPIAKGDPRCQDAGPAPADQCLDAMNLVHCFPPGGASAGFVRHCGKPSRTADERCFGFDGGAECAVAIGCTDPGCIGPALDACRPSDVVRLYHARTDCNVLGMQCIVGNNSDVGCSTDATRTRLREPDGDLGAFCDGTTRVVTSEVYLGRVDCADFGGTCVHRGLAAICALPEDECSPFTTPDTCTGTTINTCVGGKATAFDCATIGKTCARATDAGAFPAACR